MSAKILVTGGAGFVGSNLTDRLLTEGHEVTVFDAMFRAGSGKNAAWLRRMHPSAPPRMIKADIRNVEAVKAAVVDADIVYHLAGQVAVTTSLDDPRTDFDINALGTLNVLEAARASRRNPIVVFTSTNKVYGCMEDVPVAERPTRYEYTGLPHGVPETQPLDFHSPYGCSKGTADQYVRDYARIYGLRTVVFRMSCIYGPRQFGTEDQGWLAHFMISAANGWPITLYGDGKQVRDVLFVDDLIRAFRLAVEHIDETSGKVFNIGGGPANTLSVWNEFGDLLSGLAGEEIPVQFGDWRAGDQPCYVSDIRLAQRLMGWEPQMSKTEGVERLWRWILDIPELPDGVYVPHPHLAQAGGR